MTDTTMDLVPSHVFEQRVKARLDGAQAAVDAAAAMERDAFSEVDRLRGELGLNRATRGELHAGQTRLARCQEATAVAEATVRAVEREIERERDERDRAAARLAQERDAAARARDAAAVAEFRSATETFARALELYLAAVPSDAARRRGPVADISAAMSRLRRSF
jgi:hypothetical protein